MSANAEGSSGSLLSRISSWMTSFAGITAAVATIATSASAVLGLLIHHQSVQLQQAHATVSQQAQQIHALKDSVARRPAAPAASAQTGATNPPSTAPLTGIAHYLSDLTPTVDNGNVFPGQQVISARPYPKSILFPCDGSPGGQPREAYDVAGNSAFIAEVGIPDNMQDATNDIATVTFSNESGRQIGTPVQVSLGHPIKVRLSISGVTQLGMTCAGRNASTNQAVYNFEVSLGNGGVS
jgi:hypothetical protein